jgi:hypothetical protein
LIMPSRVRWEKKGPSRGLSALPATSKMPSTTPVARPCKVVAGAKIAGPQPRTAIGYDGRIYRRCIHGIFLNDDVRLVNYDGSANDDCLLHHRPMNNQRCYSSVLALVGVRLALIGSSSIWVWRQIGGERWRCESNHCCSCETKYCVTHYFVPCCRRPDAEQRRNPTVSSMNGR